MYDFCDIDDRKMNGTLRDWRKALRAPATYRVGNAVRIQPSFMILTGLVAAILLILFYCNWWPNIASRQRRWSGATRPYNTTYPLSSPLTSGDIVTFRIGLVTDLDKNSKVKGNPYTFNSYFKKGFLSYNTQKHYAVVSWDKQPSTVLTTEYSLKGRGLELSELIVFDGRLLTFDDRSGMVFELVNNKVIPWVILMDGNGHVEKGFKAEWATVKDEILYVGSMGKEWTTAAGVFENNDPMWVKAISIHGDVQHLSWINQYQALRASVGIRWPGYMIHESGVWAPAAARWYFLPRRCSRDRYNETEDEVRGCNYLITADDAFSDVKALELPKPPSPKLGFSSFKFIPGTREEAIVALRTSEFEGRTATYIAAFKTDGTVIMEDTLVDELKYEGLEFI